MLGTFYFSGFEIEREREQERERDQSKWRAWERDCVREREITFSG